MVLDAMLLAFGMLSFMPAFSLSFSTLIKRMKYYTQIKNWKLFIPKLETSKEALIFNIVQKVLVRIIGQIDQFINQSSLFASLFLFIIENSTHFVKSFKVAEHRINIKNVSCIFILLIRFLKKKLSNKWKLQ